MASPTTFGTLETVALREAWSHEARSFTPWLAENLGRISSAIGIPLELEGTEVSVGRYSADILARDPRDDSLVLIENQLEHGDHGHLGQILTYLTGLRATTVIWVAADFHDEHLSAISWLNQNTVGSFAFFAVKLKVVRIGASAMAPIFEVVERPNSWDREVQERARVTTEASPRALSRRAFWERYGERFPMTADDLAAGGANRWRQVPGTGLVISRWFGRDRSGVFVRGARGVDGATVFDQLNLHRDALEKRLGCPIGSPREPFAKHLEADSSDPSQWDRIADWLNTQVEVYQRALTELFGNGANSAVPNRIHPKS